MTRNQEVTAGLLALTGVSPRAALAAARAVLAAGPGPRDASVAHQAAAIVLRDFGDMGAALAEFRLAVRLAGRAGDPDREADALTSLGTALVMAGRTEAGLAAIDDALAMVSREPGELGRVLVRRGGSLWIAGRYAQAQADLRRAIALTGEAGDPVWEARARTAAALADLAIGAVDRAEAGLTAAERLFAGTGQQLEIAYARHNRALAAFASGDLPGALRHLDDAAARYAELGVFVPDAALDRSAVLLAAGLPADALAGVEAALAGRLTATKRAEIMLAAARIAHAAGHHDQSAERAWAARSSFTRQRRPWWRAHATLVLLQARFAAHQSAQRSSQQSAQGSSQQSAQGSSQSAQQPAQRGAGRPPARLLPEARRTAAWLEELRSDEAPDAWLLAGRIALAAGRPAEADQLLACGARAARRRVPAFARAAGALAEALRAQPAAAGRDRRRLLAACGRGFGLLEEHLATLGAAELRAHATAHGAELAELAQRAALGSGRPRLLLEWSERWRAVALRQPRPPAAETAPEARAELAALRDVTVRLEKAHPDGFPGTVLHRERLRLEAAIRARALRKSTLPSAETAAAFDAGALLDALGQARLLELVVVDGDLHVLVCGDGRVRRLAAGRAADAAWELDFARFGLNRIARGALTEPPGQALAALAEGGQRLEAVLLGPARDQLGDGPVVIVPPGRLNAVPWALLPSLAERAVSVAPSARSWLRASQPRPFGPDRTVLVAGPGLSAASAEVRTLAAEYGDATVLTGASATTSRVLAAIDGAGLAHIAAHGMFRADSPMFSSLRMADGPMTVHDLERLHRAPLRLVLPSCESGLLAPVGADELLGLASALLPLGTAGIVASVAQVSDDAAAPLMLALHHRLRTSEPASAPAPAVPGSAVPGSAAPAPGGLAAALRDARADVRQAASGDPAVTAAAWSFIALGA